MKAGAIFDMDGLLFDTERLSTIMIPDILQSTAEIDKLYAAKYSSLLGALDAIKAGEI